MRAPHSFSLRTAAGAAVVFLAIYVLYLFVAQFLHILLLTFVAIILAFIIHYPLDAMARVMPRWLAAALTLILLLGVIVAFVVLGAPLVEKQAGKLIEQIPQAVNRIHAWWRQVERNDAMDALGADVPGGMRSRIRQEFNAVLSKAVPLAMGAVVLAGTALLIMVLAVFLAYQPRAYVRGIVRLVPRRHARDVVVLLRRVGDTMRNWTAGTILSMAIVGALTAVGMFAIGIDSWLVLGILGFVGEFVPYIGPVAAAIPGILVALGESTRTGLYAAIIYLAVQGIESYVLQPIIMRRAVHIHPALLLVWQLAMASAFGLVGLFIATPFLAVIKETVEYAYIHKTLGKPLRPTVRHR